MRENLKMICAALLGAGLAATASTYAQSTPPDVNCTETRVALSQLMTADSDAIAQTKSDIADIKRSQERLLEFLRMYVTTH